MAGGDSGAWGAHWARLAVQAVLKAPVSPESPHLFQVLRLCCLKGDVSGGDVSGDGSGDDVSGDVSGDGNGDVSGVSGDGNGGRNNRAEVVGALCEALTTSTDRDIQ